MLMVTGVSLLGITAALVVATAIMFLGGMLALMIKLLPWLLLAIAVVWVIIEAVIGHEMGHVALGHVKKGMQVALGTNAVRVAAASAGGIVGSLPVALSLASAADFHAPVAEYWRQRLSASPHGCAGWKLIQIAVARPTRFASGTNPQ